MEQNANTEVMSRSRFPDGFRIMKGKWEYVTYIEHSSLRIWYSETPGAYEGHSHSAVEIIMPVRGEVTCEVEDTAYSVQDDEVVIVPPNWTHSVRMGEGSARYLLLFEPDNLFGMRDMQLVESMLHTPLYLSGQGAVQEDVRALLMQAVKCYDRRDFLWNSMCYSYLLQMYVSLGQFNATRGLYRPEDRAQRMDPEIIDSARLYIDQNYMHSITLDDVSRFTGFSRCYFSRLFKQQTGTSFTEYLRGKRVGMAEELLIHSRQPIQEIAVNAGFGSVATFNRVFRNVRKCTPTRYREIYGDY